MTMMKCRDMTLVASDFIDGRLPWRKRAAVVGHLLLCSRCRHFVTNFRSVVRVLRGHAPKPPDRDQLEHFEQAVDQALQKHGHGGNHHH